MTARRFVREVARWTIPPGIHDFARRLWKRRQQQYEILPDPDLGAGFASNVRFRDAHCAERCFILATGPSINEQYLRPLKDELCFAVGHFFLHKDIRIINPRYHVIAPYHPPFTFEEIDKLFKGFRQAYSNQDVEYFFGHRPFKYSVNNFLQQYPQYRTANMHFINYSQSPQLDENNYNHPGLWDICKMPFAPRTVIYIAIQIAVFMGVKSIYLLGCDHDYLTDIKRVANHHFYREEDGVSDVKHLSAFTLERWFEEYYYRWKQYRLMHEYLNSIGCKIYNATAGGMLDVFPRVDLSEVLS